MKTTNPVKKKVKVKIVLQPEVSATMNLDTWMWWFGQDWYFKNK